MRMRIISIARSHHAPRIEMRGIHAELVTAPAGVA